jgi:hypothetical protein
MGSNGQIKHYGNKYNVPVQDLDFHLHMSWSFWCLVSSVKMICGVRFVDIGGIDHHYLNFIFITDLNRDRGYK